MNSCHRIPPHLKIPLVGIKDISDVALDKRISKIETLLSGGDALEGVDISVEALSRISALESQVVSLVTRIQTLEAEVSTQAQTDIRHDAHIEDAERTASGIEQILDKING